MSGGPPGGDDLHGGLGGAGLLVGVAHDQQRPAPGLTEGNPPLFLLAMVIIIDRHRQRVSKYRGGLLESDPVLAAVADGFIGIPFKVVVKTPPLAAEVADHLLGLMLDDHAIEQGFDDLLVVVRHP